MLTLSMGSICRATVRPMLTLKELMTGRHHNSRPCWYARHQEWRAVPPPLAKSFLQKALTPAGLPIFFLAPKPIGGRAARFLGDRCPNPKASNGSEKRVVGRPGLGRGARRPGWAAAAERRAG